MKKYILTLVTLLLLGFLASAQRFDLGLKGGLLYSNMGTQKNFNVKSLGRTGFMVGAFARIGGDQWFFQPELQLSARNARFTGLDDKLKTPKLDIGLKTIDIPLQVGLTLLDLSVVKLYLHAGPVASFKVDDKMSISNALNSVVFKSIKDNNYNSVLWSGQVGISADILFFTIDVRYDKGFSDIAKTSIGKNDLFIVSLGFRIL